MTSHKTLEHQLEQLDGRSYSAYKSLKGIYTFSNFDLTLAHIQGDPFAPPSRAIVWLSHKQAEIPHNYWQMPLQQKVLADFLHRTVVSLMPSIQPRQRSGGYWVVAPTSQVVLARTAVQVTLKGIELRLGIGLPAFGRRIAGHKAKELLLQDLPQLVEAAFQYQPGWQPLLEQHIAVVEDACALRAQLQEKDLVAFIADGAILPRQSSVSTQPLVDAVPFKSPSSLAVTLQTPHGGAITGLGIPAGITLIVGGGYHGKSTMLGAIANGIYNHIPGDGRERVVANANTVKIRAEDGRSVTGVDVSPFISQLPQKISTQSFCTANASGSTSQAANILEAIEAGARMLLIDEDTAATNLMIRDRAMQTLIAKENEPITPFIDKVRQLYADYGISTVLVMGGSGDYFEVADHVIALENYLVHDVTTKAKAIAAQHPSNRLSEGGQHFGSITQRRLRLPDRKPAKVKSHALTDLTIGTEAVDLRGIEQLLESGQARAIAHAILTWQQQSRSHVLSDLLDDIMTWVNRQDFDALTPYPMGDLSEFRRHELAAVINRLRGLDIILDETTAHPGN